MQLFLKHEPTVDFAEDETIQDFTLKSEVCYIPTHTATTGYPFTLLTCLWGDRRHRQQQTVGGFVLEWSRKGRNLCRLYAAPCTQSSPCRNDIGAQTPVLHRPKQEFSRISRTVGSCKALVFRVRPAHNFRLFSDRNYPAEIRERISYYYDTKCPETRPNTFF